jgi:hypothetical protein
LHSSSASSKAAFAPVTVPLSQELHGLAAGLPETGFTVGDLMDRLGVRASGLLVLVCALPFTAPVSIPGLSTPFGLVIALLAARYAAGLPPWLPKRLRRVELPRPTLAKILEAGGKVIAWIERRMKHRLGWIVDRPWKLRLHALMILFAAGLLMIPLPPFPPFTNTLPAIAIVVLTMSTLERDGMGIAAGYVIVFGTVIYFAFWGALIVEVFTRILSRLGF